MRSELRAPCNPSRSVAAAAAALWLCAVAPASVAEMPLAGAPAGREPHASPPPRIELTAQEQQWLRAHPVIRLSPDPDWRPVDFIDQNGEHAGIAADYVRLAAGRLGLGIVLVKERTWPQVLQAAREGRIDMISGVLRTPERERYLAFTRPFMTVSWVVMGPADQPFGVGLRALRGHTVAVVEGTYAHERLQREHPEISALAVASETEAVAAVADGRADAAICQVAAVTSLIGDRFLGRVRVVGTLDDYRSDVQFAVRKDWPELAALLDKGLASIGPSEREQILERWMAVPVQRGLDWGGVLKWLAPVAIAVAAILIVVVAANQRLRRAERAASDQLAFFSALVNTIPSPIFYKDNDGRYLGCNPAYEHAFGVSTDWLKGKTVLDLEYLPKELRERFYVSDGELLATRGSQHQALQMRFADGAQHDVLFWKTAFDLSGGRRGGMLGVIVDITQQKSAEAEARRARRQLLDMTDAIPGAVYQYRRSPDGSMAFTFMSKGSQAIHGIPRDAFLKDWSIGVSSIVDEDRAPLLEAIEGSAHTLEPLRREYRVQAQDGIKWVRGEAVPRRAADGSVLWTGYWVDVTEEKRQGAALAAAKEQAESATRAKSAFLAAMSHEIRTPMNGILGMLEILGLSRLDAEQAQSLAIIRDSARALLRILDDILDFSKLEAARMTVEVRAMDLAEAIESVAQLFVSNARSKGLRLRCFVDARISAPVLGDSVRLGQVLSNLLSNAIKFTETGSVTLSAELQDGPDARPCVRIAVADTGIAVSPEAQARLFQPFVQAETSTSRRFGGTGLGLSISRGLVEMMHGRVEMRSQVGEGTRVIVTLPYELASTLPASAMRDLEGVRVLLVTDDAEEARFYPGCLESRGAAVRTCGVEGLAALLGGATPVYEVVMCPEFALERVRSAVERAFRGDHLALTSMPHFVALSEDPAALALRLEADTVRVATLKRARLIAAVAVAAGRESTEAQAVQATTGAGARPAPTVEAAAAQGRLILLVEDHPTNQQVILRQLNLLGFAAELAENGRIAFEKWKSGRFALVLTDCHMPEMDGYELTRAIRAAERGGQSRTPIVALTANALQGEGERCLAAGMDDYLAKPVEMTTIRGRLEKWLPERFAGDGGSPPIDRDALAGMFGEDQETIGGVLDDFLKENEKDVVELEAAIAARDADKVMYTAHRIKGAARIIGAHELADASYRLELAGRDQELSQLSELRGAFFASLDAVAHYIRAR